MRYAGMPTAMWILFRRSFRKSLVTVLNADRKTAAEITAEAKPEYKRIIRRLPAFEKGDRFKMNIVSCAMFSSFCLHLRRRPPAEQMADYYRQAMLTPAMRWFCRRNGRKMFSARDLKSMKATAVFRAADRNPYSWNMVLLPYADGRGYEARFYKCGICALMKELGLDEYIPAMCRLDYTMAEEGGACRFERKYTLASGGPYCDCGYVRLNRGETGQ